MNILRLDDINGVLDARLNILHFEIGVIIPNNGFKRNRFPDQFEDRLHGNARPGNAWLPKMNFRADLNSIHVGNISLCRHKRQGAIGGHYSVERQIRKTSGSRQFSEASNENNPTAKQSAFASTGIGTSLLFQKTNPGLKGISKHFVVRKRVEHSTQRLRRAIIFTSGLANLMCNSPATLPACPARLEQSKD